MKVLLLGRKGIVVEDVQNQLNIPKVELFSGTNLEEVRSIFAENKIDHVIMGAGIELQERLNIIQIIFELSESTTVHMKDFASGPQGMLPFVSSILSGLQN
ncbi:hypothetical protein KW507_07825 [Vibrio fluvialis]|nr:hypothetical protein [Vibrio fluvialis]